jgi:hypothetical protein
LKPKKKKKQRPAWNLLLYHPREFGVVFSSLGRGKKKGFGSYKGFLNIVFCKICHILEEKFQTIITFRHSLHEGCM